jgi:predicted O-linked N-acetylglucosamine transferase (SPINDLY family)
VPGDTSWSDAARAPAEAARGDALLRQGECAFQSGRVADALGLFAQAAAQNPRAASCAGVACQVLGRLDEAEAWHRQAAGRAPDDPFVLNNLGALLAGRGQLVEAATVLRRARQVAPADGEIATNLAGTLRGLGRLDEALAVGQDAVRLAPGLAQAHNNLGNVLLDRGEVRAACERYEAAVRLDPGLAAARRGLGDALVRLGQPADAARVYAEAVRRRPAEATSRSRLAQALVDAGQAAAAIGEARAAVQLDPTDAPARNTLGSALVEAGDLDAAALEFEAALARRPGWSVPGYNLGICRQRQGRMDEARDAFRQALAANPNDALAGATYAGSLFYDPVADAATLLREHRHWADRHAPAPVAEPYTNVPDPDRPLRVGYLSPDFRNHAVAFFLQPVLKHHDPQHVESICYVEVPAPDARTAELRSLARGWRHTPGLSDADLAALVRRDGIDILVDLAGHLAGGRLRTVALRPAPVQVSYLGYPGTTGLAALDYRLTDAVADPPEAETGYAEELVRLPGCFCCYQPPPPLPSDSEPPSRRSGFVTFGSLHKLEKLNGGVLDLWCELLRQLPGSRLLLARHHLRGATAEHWRGAFARRGVAPERVVVEAPAAVEMGHLRLYDRVDVALDPFPWGGHTTACEALWMGVPTVTLLGERYAGRMVASVLQTLGLPELVAATASDYRRIALELAVDEGRRAGWRKALRPRLLASPLCDGAAFTRGLEATYRRLWQRWCQARPNSSPAAARSPASGGANCR